ncbi:glycosyltransferase family 4 protein [Marinomonas sp.]|jgi:UDP-glucose:(heptosyl)LPS alpha-1,3-glucosyltransferase|uniref:Glycosyl transferase group 1 n=1 Tax=Marinomonas sp. (strain MWYL1) TaxID=400668 RepID=A6VVA4_MARMS
MKTVLIAKQNLEKTYSGACRSVHEEIKYFSSVGCEVHTISENANVEDIKKSGGISHKSKRFFWQKKFKRRIQFSNETLKLAKKIKADLLIGHGDLQHPDVHFIHNCVHLAAEKIHNKPLSKNDEMYLTHTPIFQNHQFKHIVANSYLTKNELIARFSVPEKDISVIYPAIDESQFKILSNEVKARIRKDLDVKEDELLVGLVTSGNFKKRGIDRFFEAISLLPEEIANKTHFVFVGKDQLTQEFQAILDRSPYKNRVRQLPIINNVEEYFNALDIFVLPARIEEFGRVVAEAMACGAPVITTKWVGASELMKNESAGFIYDGESNQVLANLMDALLSDKALRDRVSLENQESAKEVYESALDEKFNAVFNPYLR